MTKAIATVNTNIETKEVKEVKLSKRELKRKPSILVKLKDFEASLSKKYGSEFAKTMTGIIMNHGLSFDDVITESPSKNTIVMTRSTKREMDFGIKLVESNKNVGDFSEVNAQMLTFKDGTTYVYLIQRGNPTYLPKKEYTVSSAYKDLDMLPKGVETSFEYGTKKVFAVKKFGSIDAIFTIFKFFKEYIISEKPTEVITRKGMIFTHFKSL